jgi:hypothetical protein
MVKKRRDGDCGTLYLENIILSRYVIFDEHLLISDFRDDSNHNASNQSYGTILDPFLLATGILSLVFNVLSLGVVHVINSFRVLENRLN